MLKNKKTCFFSLIFSIFCEVLSCFLIGNHFFSIFLHFFIVFQGKSSLKMVATNKSPKGRCNLARSGAVLEALRAQRAPPALSPTSSDADTKNYIAWSFNVFGKDAAQLAVNTLLAARNMSVEAASRRTGMSAKMITEFASGKKRCGAQGDMRKRKSTKKADEKLKRQKQLHQVASKTVVVRGKLEAKYKTTKNFQAAMATKKYGAFKLSTSTVRQDLIDAGFKSFKCRKRPFAANQTAARLKFVESKVFNAGRHMEDRIIFIDEAIFSTQSAHVRSQWAKVVGDVATFEKVNDYNVSRQHFIAVVGVGVKSDLMLIPTEKVNGKNERMNAEKYKTFLAKKGANGKSIIDLLKSKVPYGPAKGWGRFLLQDNARPHIAKTVKEYLHAQGVQLVEDYPACSPDLNPIESVWALLKQRRSKKYNAAGDVDKDELVRQCQEVWNEIKQEEIDNFCRHFKRAADVVRANGGGGAAVVATVWVANPE
jgi:transposase